MPAGLAIPNWLGALVAIAGFGYVIDTALALALASCTGLSLGAFALIREVALLLWLLVGGSQSIA